jgi:hypothetical protein
MKTSQYLGICGLLWLNAGAQLFGTQLAVTYTGMAVLCMLGSIYYGILKRD